MVSSKKVCRSPQSICFRLYQQNSFQYGQNICSETFMSIFLFLFTLKDHLSQKQVFSENLIEDLSRLFAPKLSNKRIHFQDNWNSCNVEFRRSFSYFAFCRIYQSVYSRSGIPFNITATGKKIFFLIQHCNIKSQNYMATF